MIILRVAIDHPNSFIDKLWDGLDWVKCEYLLEVSPYVHDFKCTSRKEYPTVVSMRKLTELARSCGGEIIDIKISLYKD